MGNKDENNKRIAKNAIYLYIRTVVIMLVTLYTSRVILNTLGVQDYGVYNAVGGVVSMFAFLTAALSAAISRYITYELGRDRYDIDRLRVIFSTSIRIQFALGTIILILGEVVGVWFLNTHMNIPTDRMDAANWVWQCCLISFIINLISVPYNASIIAHEHMNAYAFVSIIDAVLRLVICYLLITSPIDKLTTYAILHVIVATIIRIIYGVYCRHYFKECKYTRKSDKNLAKKMFGFAGFSFLNNSVSIFNHQGINLLVNMYFGVMFNAARGVASQLDGAIMQLVNNLTVAVNPQITKSYAAGDKNRMFNLICNGSKYAFYLMLLMALPVFLEAEYILRLWLKIVPDYSVLFLRLTLIGAMVNMIGKTGYTACMATGNIKKYSIWVTVFGITAFPLTLCAYKSGFPVECCYYAYILAYIMVEIVRLVMMKQLIEFPPLIFVKEVVVNALIVTSVSVILPLYFHLNFEQGIIRFVVVCLVSVLSSTTSIFLLGMKHEERLYMLNLILKRFKKK